MKGYLTLEDGSQFEGELDDPSSCEGEIVFYTGMTGYQEVLTDPSYHNQIVVFTYPLIGNYGINTADFESKKPQVKGAIFYECCDAFSHYEAKRSVKDYLGKWKVPYLYHTDTREVVKRIRVNGSMKASISIDGTKSLDSFEEALVEKVACTNLMTCGEGDLHIALIDFGFKKSILQSLVDRQCKVTVIPYHQLHEVMALSPDGVVFSNGPGDPKQLTSYLEQIKQVASSYPSLGICLGHQLLTLAFGGNTKKLSFGHRGANHPVVDTHTGKVFMTSQNHSYVVDSESLEQTELLVRFKHINDDSVEGIYHPEYPIMSVQFHPEAHPGPTDTEWIFDEFLANVRQPRREIAYA
ncbi:carbamoyl phosphate synthase small subunit [Metabacillus arenae]|uniref:Carbamoyl phosphate synthase small chain n=1 Tax=Metabacillus arenae TaxID=2771434 RepID=A0A926S024_9BACI|nr:carbamoyl phosphate synthase small subunit [Metabacillus arenae]MBD1383450.1 carbamoyl phosphate synthase small subunit [Metabacillus arenae]